MYWENTDIKKKKSNPNTFTMLKKQINATDLWGS